MPFLRKYRVRIPHRLHGIPGIRIRPDHAGDSRSPLSAAEVEKQYPDFFKMLLRHVKQGFYGHPRHGGNAGWASYRMLGIAAPSVTGRNIPGKENHL